MEDEDDFNFAPPDNDINDFFSSTSSAPLQGVSDRASYMPGDASHERMLQAMEPTYDEAHDEHNASSAPRNFQALLSLPTAQLPKTVLPQHGEGHMSIRNALHSLIGAATKARYGRFAKNIGGGKVTVPTSAEEAGRGSVSGFSEAANAVTTATSLSLPISQNPMLGRYSWKQQRNVSQPWSDDETRRFFDALQQYGADFSLVCVLFPGRRREDVKKKFHHELKARPQLIEEALHSKSQLPVDLDMLDDGIQRWKEYDSRVRVTPLTAEDEQLLQEFVLKPGEERVPNTREGNGGDKFHGNAAQDDFSFADDGTEAVAGTSGADDGFFGNTFDDEDVPLAEQFAIWSNNSAAAADKPKATRAKKANPKKEGEAGKKRAREPAATAPDSGSFAEGGNEFEFL